MHFYYKVIFALPKGMNPDPGFMNFTNLVENFRDIITMHLVFLTYI